LAANSTDVHDNYNYLGVHNQASDDYDVEFDAYELMPMGNEMMMVYFPNAEANLTADIRNSIGDPEVWTVNVETYNVNEPVTISWPNIAELPVHYGALLINTETGEQVDMRSNANYTFTPAVASTQSLGDLGVEHTINHTPVLLSERTETGVITPFEVQIYEIMVSAELATFEAISNLDNIALNWSTSNEDADHLGFNVYRVEGNGLDMAEFVKANTELIISGNMNYVFTDANVEDGSTYTYKLATFDTWGNETEAGRLTVTYIPKRVFELSQNYPNPFNPTTTITFSLPVAGDASLKVFNSAGQLVRTLIEGTVEAGAHNIVWDGRNDRSAEVASGVYFYVLEQNDNKATNKMILVK
jgi:hypothetical protein